MQIEAEEAARGSWRAVAGFDVTFSVPKSAHHETVVAVVAFMECEVAAIRTGATAGDGAVAQVDVTGLITSIPAPGTRTCIRMW